MRISLLFNTALVFICLFLQAKAQDGRALFQLNVESFLVIKGSSNVNKFECKIDGTNIQDNIIIDYQTNGHELEFRNFKITLEVNHFDCKNSMITSDFKKSLKSDEYPIMTIDFLKMIFPENLEPFERLFPDGIMSRVTLTDKRKNYYIALEKENLETEEVKLKGNLAVNMNDFGLEPPEKMFSLIKVDPLLNIEFELSMNRLKSEK